MKVTLLRGPLDGLEVTVRAGERFIPSQSLLSEWGFPRSRPHYDPLYEGKYVYTGDFRYPDSSTKNSCS